MGEAQTHVELPPVNMNPYKLSMLEQKLHFPGIIDPGFVFFSEEKDRSSVNSLKIGRALAALSLDASASVALD